MADQSSKSGRWDPTGSRSLEWWTFPQPDWGNHDDDKSQASSESSQAAFLQLLRLMTSCTMWLPLSNRLFRNCYAVKQRILRWNKVNQATARRHAAESQLTKKGAKSTEIQPSPQLQPIEAAIFHLCGKRSEKPIHPTGLQWNAQRNHSSTATPI